MDWWVEAKVSWWRQGYDWRVDGTPKLRVTGRRLDSTAEPLVADEANVVGISFPKAYMMDSLYFPTLGCWEITGRYKDDELTFVVWVPGDTVVSKAGIVYVVGDVHRPVGVVMEDTGPITVLRVLATAEGANPTANLQNAKSSGKAKMAPPRFQ